MVGGVAHQVLGEVFVLLGVFFQAFDDGAGQRHGLGLVDLALEDRLDLHLEKRVVEQKSGDPGPDLALHQGLDRSVGQLQQLQDGSNRADPAHVLFRWTVNPRVFLGDQKNGFVAVHGVGKGIHRPVAPDEKRGHHIGKNHHVPQRDQRQLEFGLRVSVLWFKKFRQVNHVSLFLKS